ncbi:hypothetical protein [Egicoccus sp. AB-alg6-2]|uniref:hypothetical protein n=1 Tax=Egicoccus sp. AB-alg6-2 TaxID=3242692 RepID=UPI00359E661B
MSDLRIEVRQGAPTTVDLAAIVVALTPVDVPRTDEPETRGGRRATPAWTRAALLEGVGGRVAVSPADLVQPRS